MTIAAYAVVLQELLLIPRTHALYTAASCQKRTLSCATAANADAGLASFADGAAPSIQWIFTVSQWLLPKQDKNYFFNHKRLLYLSQTFAEKITCITLVSNELLQAEER